MLVLSVSTVMEESVAVSQGTLASSALVHVV